MTGGEAIILGNIGDNFGAGMTGGSAFIYSDQYNLTDMMNKETIQAYQIKDDNWKVYLLNLLKKFNNETESKRSAYIIENYEQEITKFVHVIPNEVIDKLNYPVIEQHKIA